MATAAVKKAVQAKSAVSTNRAAFEVIPRGSEIVIESAEIIDQRAIASGVRLGTGRAKPDLTNKGRRVTLRVDDLVPLGQNTLYLSDLYTPEGAQIEANFELPFFVINTPATLPAGVRFESYQRVVLEGDTVRRASPQ